MKIGPGPIKAGKRTFSASSKNINNKTNDINFINHLPITKTLLRSMSDKEVLTETSLNRFDSF